jgi:hypothetical protein
LSTNKIAKTWISGQCSATLIIEKSLAEEYGLTKPSHVVLERRPEGILIRKLSLKGIAEKRRPCETQP